MTTLVDTYIKKNRLIRYIIYAFLAIGITLLQLTLLNLITIANISPDFLIILCVIIALREGMLPALFAGFLIGLFYDILTLDVIGTNALSKTIVAFISGFFYKEDFFKPTISNIKFFWIVLLSCFVHNLIYYFFYIRQSELNFFVFFFKYGIASTLYTSLFAFFIILAYRKKND